jgi:hypothetical protein
VTETVDSISWIEEADKAVRLARNAGEAQRQADLLADSRAALGIILSYFQELRASADALRGLAWEGKSPSPDLSRDLKDAIRTLDSRPLHRVQNDVDRFGREVATSLKECWKSHAAQQLGDVGDLLTLAVTLSGVQGITEVSQELSTVLRKLEGLRESLPGSESAELLSKAEELLGQLESSLKPESVRRFLSAVARGGAPVQNLTAEVTKWLEDHHSLNRFKIIAGAPVEDPGV